MNQQEKVWTPVFVNLTLISLLIALCTQGLVNAISLYVDNAGLSTRLSGLFTMIYAFSGAFGRFAGGFLSDRKSRRNTMLIGGSIFFCGVALPILLPT